MQINKVPFGIDQVLEQGDTMSEMAYREAERRLWEAEGCEPTERFVPLAVTGTQVRVQEVGEGEPVLFIHGGPNSGSTWAPLVGRLEGLRCLVLDRPGTGLSDDHVVLKSSLPDFASRLVPDVLDVLGVERAHVVASSFGGYCALRSAARSPERFDRMVQMACPALLPGQQLPPFMKTIMKPGLRKLIAALPPNKKAQESIMRQIGHGASLDAGILSEIHGDWYSALSRHTRTMRNEFDMIHSVRAPGGFDESVALDEEALQEIAVPTHFIWGEDDTFGGAEEAKWVTTHMPDASFEMIEKSGHLPWLDDPAYVAEATAGFLAGEVSIDGTGRAKEGAA